ncbi:hypothetical protein C8Q73DRAFT_702761 [Cubamyces lactineus]|nr:hypothetical protein C8Q73DRAFT_702761 [Cubamyces lactineus]
MSPIRTRARTRARQENAVVRSTPDKPSGTVPSSKSHRGRIQSIKHARRRQTTFAIEQHGHRVEVLVDCTERMNAIRRAKERRLTIAHLPFPGWLSDEVAPESPPKPTEIQKSPFKRHTAARATPRVRWAQHVRIFSGHTQETPKAITQPKPTPPAPILVYRDPSPTKEALVEPEQDKQSLGSARGGRPHRAYVEIPHPDVTMRSRSRSRSRPRRNAQIFLPLASTPCHDSSSGSGSLSSSVGSGLSDPHVRRQTSTGTLASAASGTQLATASAGLHTLSVCVCRVEARCAGAVSSSSTEPHLRRKEASSVTTTSGSRARFDSSSLSPIHQSVAEAPHDGRVPNRVDQWFLRFGIVYSVFISVMFFRMFGVW